MRGLIRCEPSITTVENENIGTAQSVGREHGVSGVATNYMMSDVRFQLMLLSISKR